MKYYNLLFFIFLILILDSCSRDMDSSQIFVNKNQILFNNKDVEAEFVVGSREIILEQTEAWENQALGYFNVLERDSVKQLWYTSWRNDMINDLSSFLCYAEFQEGKWFKPKVNNGTNILMGDGKYYGIVEQFVFYDKAIDKYKMIGVSLNRAVGKSQTYLYTSNDGKSWYDPKVIFPFYYDTQFSVIIDNENYIIYQRIFENGKRIVGKSIINNDGSVVKPPAIVFDENYEINYKHIYNNAASKLNDSTVVMFPTYYDNENDKMFISLAYERKGKVYPTGKNFNIELFQNDLIQWGVVSPGLFGTGEENTYWLYYYGSSLPHNLRTKNIGGFTKYYRIKVRLVSK